jgi:hypothetical protein
MKNSLAILASAALLTAPLAIPSTALAQGHGGGHSGGHGGGHGGGGHGGGGFHGGGFHGGGGFRGGGFRGGGGYRGGYRGGYGYGAAALGLGLGLGLGYAPFYGENYDYPDVAYDPGYAYAPPACGQWVWNPPAGRYDWVAVACQ